MKLGRKLRIAKLAIASITQHDDAPLADRAEAVIELREYIDAEVLAAGARDAARRTDELADTPDEATEYARLVRRL